MHSTLSGKPRNRLTALLCACVFGVIAAGCHNNNFDSGYGIAWVSLTDQPGDFTSYIVTVDAVTLTGKLNGTVGAIEAPEIVDFTKLKNISELWATASVPVDTYTQASITLDYTVAQISVMVNGVPTAVTPVDPTTGAPATTVTVNINFDPTGELTLLPTYATTDAHRLAIDFDLEASNVLNLAATPTPTVTVKPYFTVSIAPFDSRLIRVRGPLVNSSVHIGTYSVEVRPFFDEINSLGTLSVFNDPNTIYTLNGTSYVGSAGISALSQSSAGSTITAAYTTFEPTATPLAGAGVVAGIFHSVYVVAGGTLEDFFTDGLEGDVIARSGNTLTLRNATLIANASQQVQHENADSIVILGPSTIVTADGIASNPALNYNSISVGQHIVARGLYSLSPTNVVTLDATGSTATDTGSVRLLSTEAFGSLVSGASGSVVLNLQAIDDYPASVFNFAGNGASAAQDPTPANYIVNTGSLPLPPAGVGDPIFVDGYTAPFGSAPPDFLAQAVNAQSTVPAVMVVTFTGTGTVTPFASLSDSGLSINLADPAFGSGVIRVGAESIDMTTLGGTPQIVPAPAVPAPTPGLPALILPLFAIGVGGQPTVVTNPIDSFNSFAEFVTQAQTTLAAPTPVTKFVSRGFFNRASDLFTASTIDVVL